MPSKIEWTEETWNPVTGCSKVSEGCRNCYAEKLSHRFGWTDKPWTAMHALENVKLHSDRLDIPLTWKRPRRIFVNSMSDLFHEQVPFEFIRAVWARMADANQHTFQVLTKRPDQAVAFFDWMDKQEFRVESTLSNVWLGVSVENQKAADERIPILLQTPAAVRFLSCEPLLGQVDLGKWVNNLQIPCSCGYVFETAFAQSCKHDGRTMKCPSCESCKCDKETIWKAEDRLLNDVPGWEWRHPKVQRNTLIDWVIVGGESGPGSRPMHPYWARDIRDQCQAAGVPFFFKQWGEFALHEPNKDVEPEFWVTESGAAGYVHSSIPSDYEGELAYMDRVGKKKAGRILSKREWNEMPNIGMGV